MVIIDAGNRSLGDGAKNLSFYSSSFVFSVKLMLTRKDCLSQLRFLEDSVLTRNEWMDERGCKEAVEKDMERVVILIGGNADGATSSNQW